MGRVPHSDIWSPPEGRRRPGQRAVPYVAALRDYAGLRPTRLDVPGHKGGPGAPPELARLLGPACLEVDVPPLLWGIDDGESETPMARALELAAEAWGAQRTWFLTNGASQGNQLACLATRALGSEIVVQRSVHSSVVDGIVLAGLTPHFAMPTVDHDIGVAHGVTPETLAAALHAAPDAVAAIVVSPSYFGAVADVAALADAAHAAGAALIVDEAWGAHFGFHPALPSNALSAGADLVVSSTHKMGGSLTQAAMLHVGHGPLAGRLEAAIERVLPTLQSTSASALLHASLDAARQHLACSGERLIGRTLEAVGAVRRELAAMDHLALADGGFLDHPDVVATDPLRVVVDVRRAGLSGYEAGALLREVHAIDVEVRNAAAVVAVFGATEDVTPALSRIVEGFAALRRGPAAAPRIAPGPPPPPCFGEPVMSPRDAFLGPVETVALGDAVGRVSADALAAYPPGIPNLLPGERVTSDHVAFLRATVARGGTVRGAATREMDCMRVVARAVSAEARPAARA